MTTINYVREDMEDAGLFEPEQETEALREAPVTVRLETAIADGLRDALAKYERDELPQWEPGDFLRSAFDRVRSDVLDSHAGLPVTIKLGPVSFRSLQFVALDSLIEDAGLGDVDTDTVQALHRDRWEVRFLDGLDVAINEQVSIMALMFGPVAETVIA